MSGPTADGADSRPAVTLTPPDPALLDPALFDPALSGPARSDSALSNPALSGPALSEPIQSGSALSGSALSGSALSDPATGRDGTVDPAVVAVFPVVPDDEDYLDERADWAWVEEWRAGREPVPWGPGLALAGFALFLVASAVYVLSSGLADRPILAIGVNVLVAAGLGPALWLSRSLPVLRWIAGGAAIGVIGAWLAALVFLT